MLRASDSDATTTDMVTVTVRPALTGNVIDVPAEQPTLQAAVQAASSGDTILLAPGTYQGGVWVQGKSLTIASRYLTTDDPAFTGQTVVNGVIANACGGASGCAGDAVIEFGSQAGGSKVIGLTVSGGADGVRSSARVDVSHSRLTGNVDGIDYGNDSGGTMSDDLFDHNTDDGLDLNGRVALAVRNSTVEANEGDGVEFRMYPYTGPTLEVSFVGNRFLGNDTDGIQLIDSDGASSRVVRIERNVFHGNGAASIGCLPNEQTNEDFSGAPLARACVRHQQHLQRRPLRRGRRRQQHRAEQHLHGHHGQRPAPRRWQLDLRPQPLLEQRHQLRGERGRPADVAVREPAPEL